MKTPLLIAAFCCSTAFFPASAGTVAYSVSASGQFGIVDLVTGGYSAIGSGLPSLVGLGQSGGVLYALGSTGALVTIDGSTGTATSLGNLGINATAFASMENGALFAVDRDWYLYSVDPVKASAKSIGPIRVGATPFPALGSLGFADSLAGNASSLFFTLDLWTTTPGDVLPSKLYNVDPLTGAAATIGPTGQEDIVGSGFVNGQLYGFTGIFVNPSHQIFLLDTTTGAATFQANVGLGAGSLYSAAGPVDGNAVPEPGTVSLSALALAFAWGVGKLRQISR